MAKTAPTTVTETSVKGDVSNSRDIKWPFDRYGFTTLLRKEGVRAIGRIKGNDEKLTVLIDTLRVLAAHADTKVGVQRRDAERQLLAEENRAKAAYARSLADQEAEVARLERLLASAKEAVAAKKAMPQTEEK